MLKNIAWAVLEFLTRMLIFLAIVAVSPIALPIFSYYLLRAKEYSRTVSIMVSLAVFTVVSSLYFFAVIVPIFMPNLAIAASIIDLSQGLLVLCPRILQVLAELLVHFFPPSPPPQPRSFNDYSDINQYDNQYDNQYEEGLTFQNLSTTKRATALLSNSELALIKTLLDAATAIDPQKPNRVLLRSLSECYVALKEKIDAVQQALNTNKVLENFDDFCPYTDVAAPVLCVKEYKKDGAWLAVPNMSYITDHDFIVEWSGSNQTHPLNRESLFTPSKYVDNGVRYNARYSFYQLTKNHCWASELDESALKIRELIKQLKPQSVPSAANGINNFFSRMFSQAATTNELSSECALNPTNSRT